MALTDDAKAEIAEAIRIIREDRFEKFVRSRQTPADPPKDPVFDPSRDPDPTPDPPKDPPVDPPPPKDPPTDPAPSDPPKGRKSAYWGEIFY
jgi:hypothetical protein